jgi:hypothetical protein
MSYCDCDLHAQGSDDHSARMNALFQWYDQYFCEPEPEAAANMPDDAYIATTSSFVLFPTATLALLERIRHLSSGRFFVSAVFATELSSALVSYLSSIIIAGDVNPPGGCRWSVSRAVAPVLF